MFSAPFAYHEEKNKGESKGTRQKFFWVPLCKNV